MDKDDPCGGPQTLCLQAWEFFPHSMNFVVFVFCVRQIKKTKLKRNPLKTKSMQTEMGCFSAIVLENH